MGRNTSSFEVSVGICDGGFGGGGVAAADADVAVVVVVVVAADAGALLLPLLLMLLPAMTMVVVPLDAAVTAVGGDVAVDCACVDDVIAVALAAAAADGGCAAGAFVWGRW